jgi:peptidoglycan/xylan/chitin deacetylase (PgdA/CDA1 family)
VIRALDRHGAKGTFYVVGSQIPGRTALLGRMIRGGHEIGNHSNGHALTPSPSNLAVAGSGGHLAEPLSAASCGIYETEGHKVRILSGAL